MTIKQLGGVFGRNPTFNDVTIEGELTFNGDIDVGSDLKVDGDLEVTGTIAVGNSSAGAMIDVRTDAGEYALRLENASGGYFRVADGGLTEVGGNVKFTNAGSGIDFSATAGTGTSELLDDYEEGTWTPANDSMTVNSGTFAATGTYVKIGKLVFIDVIQTSGTVSAGSGAGMISGFPFTPARTSTVSYSNGAGTLVGVGITETNSKFYGGTAFSSQTALRFSSVYTV
tara:strand:- start:1393 stop:2076 length:684 start_codon:yes stop_codon:yes gene_type:complete